MSEVFMYLTHGACGVQSSPIESDASVHPPTNRGAYHRPVPQEGGAGKVASRALMPGALISQKVFVNQF